MNRGRDAPRRVVGLHIGHCGRGRRATLPLRGCFHPPTQTVSDITDERMLLSVSTLQSTLYDQIRYTGSPSISRGSCPFTGRWTSASAPTSSSTRSTS